MATAPQTLCIFLGGACSYSAVPCNSFIGYTFQTLHFWEATPRHGPDMTLPTASQVDCEGAWELFGYIGADC